LLGNPLSGDGEKKRSEGAISRKESSLKPLDWRWRDRREKEM
jgi:hypothetical protein